MPFSVGRFSVGRRGIGPALVRHCQPFRLGIGGDLLTAGDGQPIQDKETLKRLMDKKHGGDMLELTVYRNGRSEKIRLRLGEAPQQF